MIEYTATISAFRENDDGEGNEDVGLTIRIISPEYLRIQVGCDRESDVRIAELQAVAAKFQAEWEA